MKTMTAKEVLDSGLTVNLVHLNLPTHIASYFMWAKTIPEACSNPCLPGGHLLSLAARASGESMSPERRKFTKLLCLCYRMFWRGSLYDNVSQDVFRVMSRWTLSLASDAEMQASYNNLHGMGIIFHQANLERKAVHFIASTPQFLHSEHLSQKVVSFPELLYYATDIHRELHSSTFSRRFAWRVINFYPQWFKPNGYTVTETIPDTGIGPPPPVPEVLVHDVVRMQEIPFNGDLAAGARGAAHGVVVPPERQSTVASSGFLLNQYRFPIKFDWANCIKGDVMAGAVVFYSGGCLYGVKSDQTNRSESLSRRRHFVRCLSHCYSLLYTFHPRCSDPHLRVVNECLDQVRDWGHALRFSSLKTIRFALREVRLYKAAFSDLDKALAEFVMGMAEFSLGTVVGKIRAARLARSIFLNVHETLTREFGNVYFLQKSASCFRTHYPPLVTVTPQFFSSIRNHTISDS